MTQTAKRYKAVGILVLLIGLINVVEASVVIPRVLQMLEEAFPGQTVLHTVSVGMAMVSVALPVALGLWGLHKIKTRSSGVGPFVLATVVSLWLLMELIYEISGTASSEELFSVIIRMFSTIISMVLVVVFGWFAYRFRKEIVAENKKKQ